MCALCCNAGRGSPCAVVLDGVPFGQPALSLAAQSQRRAQRAGITPGFPMSADGADSIGAALMALVARVSEAGVDPEQELRAAARRFDDSVREPERSVGSADD